MNREKAFALLSDMDDRFVEEALRYAPEAASGSSERIVHMKKKRIVTLALAAALLLALGVTGYAVNAAVATPEAAEKVALDQLEKWKELGLISKDVAFDGHADQIVELEEYNGGDYWYGRIFRHRYDVRWYFGWDGSRKYGCSLSVDTISGKIMLASFYAVADDNDRPVGETTISNENGAETVVYFYDNFDDILPTDLTVDRFCALLAEYWGFSGYRLEDTRDDFYDSFLSAPDGSTLLVDLPRSNGTGRYITIYFEGDQDGAPMYFELNQFPGHVCVNLGTNHAVG